MSIFGKKVDWWKLWQKRNLTWRPMINLKLTKEHFLNFCHSYCIGLRHLLCWGMWCWYAGWLAVVVVGPSPSFWPSTTLSRISRGVPGPQLSRDFRSHFFLCRDFNQASVLSSSSWSGEVHAEKGSRFNLMMDFVQCEGCLNHALIQCTL